VNPIAILVLVVVVGVLLLAVMSRGAGKSSVVKRGRVDQELVTSKWQAVTRLSGAGGLGLKNAVSEADKLFDYVLRESGYPGTTMAERLKAAESRLTKREGVWRAHKLRNAIAHDVGFDLVSSQAKEALRDFEQGLKDLGALR
jgi:hypothetical protein